MPFLNLDNNWSKLAPLYNQNFNGKPEVPKKIEQFNSFDEGLIRGGVINAALSSFKDVKRVGNFFLSSKGVLFLLKQVGLQLSNPRLEWDRDNKTPPFLGGPNRQFTGAGILASTAGTAFGLHFDRGGLLGMIKGDQKYGGNINETTSGIAWKNNFGENSKNNTISREAHNRLVRYSGVRADDKNSENSLLLERYFGGPESVYGIGGTTIRSYNDRTSVRKGDIKGNPTLSLVKNLNGFFNTPPQTIPPELVTFRFSSFQSNENPYLRSNQINNPNADSLLFDNPSEGGLGPGGVTEEGVFLASQIGGISNPNNQVTLAGVTIFNSQPYRNFSYYTTGSFIPGAIITTEQLAKTEKTSLNSLDLEKILKNSPRYWNTTIASQNIEKRIGVSGKNRVDSINVIDITDSSTFYTNENQQNLSNSNSKLVDGGIGKDIIKFRIEFLNNDTPVVGNDINTDVLAFRAYIDSLDDGMQAKWNSYRYMGRGEEFYIYDGFTRDINLTFTIFAHTFEEMRPIYKKLNYFLSTFTPDYSPANKMRGNIGYLTVGDYLYRVPGVFTDIKLNGMLDHHWETNVNDTENTYQVPKHIKVNLGFKPIHSLLPRKTSRDKPFLSNFILPEGVT